MTNHTPKDVWELVISSDRLARDGMPIAFEAEEGARSRIASDLDLAALPQLSGSLTATPWHRGGVRVSGVIEARAVHESVVTLDPVERHYRFDYDVTYIPDTSKLVRPRGAEEQELVVDPEADDPPEPFSGDKIDLAPLILEHLALELDPYPRQSGEAFETIDTDPVPEADVVSPFAKLEALKKQQTDD